MHATDIRQKRAQKTLAKCLKRQAGSEFLYYDTPSKLERDALVSAGWEQVGQGMNTWAGHTLNQRYQLRIRNPHLAA